MIGSILFRPAVTEMVDRALKTMTYLPTYRYLSVDKGLFCLLVRTANKSALESSVLKTGFVIVTRVDWLTRRAMFG